MPSPKYNTSAMYRFVSPFSCLLFSHHSWRGGLIYSPTILLHPCPIKIMWRLASSIQRTLRSIEMAPASRRRHTQAPSSTPKALFCAVLELTPLAISPLSPIFNCLMELSDQPARYQASPVIAGYLISPTGSYSSQRAFNTGENRFRTDLQMGFQTPITNSIDVIIAVDAMWFGGQ